MLLLTVFTTATETKILRAMDNTEGEEQAGPPLTSVPQQGRWGGVHLSSGHWGAEAANLKFSQLYTTRLCFKIKAKATGGWWETG